MCEKRRSRTPRDPRPSASRSACLCRRPSSRRPPEAGSRRPFSYACYLRLRARVCAGARRRATSLLAFFGKFWAVQVLGCSSTPTTAGRCRALAQRFMRVEALAGSARLHELRLARVLYFFFLFSCENPRRERKHPKHPSHLRNQGWASHGFWDFSSHASLLALASRLPRPRQLYSDGFTLRARASIAVLTHSFTKSCAAWLAQPTPW